MQGFVGNTVTGGQSSELKMYWLGPSREKQNKEKLAKKKIKPLTHF